MTRVATPIFDHGNPNIFRSTFSFHEFVSTCEKSSLFLSICSWDIVDLKILQSDWPRGFWPVSQELDFFQVWNLHRNPANNIHLDYRPNSKKLITKFSNILKKPYFLAHFPIFGAKIFFPKNTALSCTTQQGLISRKKWWPNSKIIP